jgi:hypothetical protein
VNLVRKEERRGPKTWPKGTNRDINQTLDSITTQNNLERFLNNAENAQKVDGLVGDIHDALMGYQVCAPKLPMLITSKQCPRPHFNRISITRAVKQL